MFVERLLSIPTQTSAWKDNVVLKKKCSRKLSLAKDIQKLAL